MRNLQEQVKKALCCQKLFWPFTQKICKFSAFSLEFQKFFSITRTIFFLTVGQNNFGNKIPFLDWDWNPWNCILMSRVLSRMDLSYSELALVLCRIYNIFCFSIKHTAKSLNQRTCGLFSYEHTVVMNSRKPVSKEILHESLNQSAE